MKTVTEKTLRKLALGCSFFGLILLFFVSQIVELEPSKIGEITIDDLGKTVKICGVIENKFVSQGNHTFFDLKDESGKIKIVLFKQTAQNLEKFEIDIFQLKNGDETCVLGEVDEWNYELEVKCKKLEVR